MMRMRFKATPWKEQQQSDEHHCIRKTRTGEGGEGAGGVRTCCASHLPEAQEDNCLHAQKLPESVGHGRLKLLLHRQVEGDEAVDGPTGITAVRGIPATLTPSRCRCDAHSRDPQVHRVPLRTLVGPRLHLPVSNKQIQQTALTATVMKVTMAQIGMMTMYCKTPNLQL
eukprot:749980-Hanusia_phi.AAC.6